jgi:hypothetical protein
MDDNSANLPVNDSASESSTDPQIPDLEAVSKLRSEFQSRLLIASLRTEAVRAGMVDLDGLKLLELTSVRLDDEDKIVGGQKIMEDLRRNKPWLFSGRSSSNPIVAPASQPVREKSALEMTDEEYAAARSAVTKYRV